MMHSWSSRALETVQESSFLHLQMPAKPYSLLIRHALQVYQLYTHSFAGYGYNDARQAILHEANTVTDGWSQPTVLIDPCALQGRL